MGTIGWLDTVANYTPTINIVAGNSAVRQKTTVGINTHAPTTESYAFDVNGPIHIKNGELTISSQTNYEVLALAVGKTASFNAIAVGTPTTTSLPYKMTFLETRNSGELWKPSYDLAGLFIEGRINNPLNSAYVYDANLSFIAGGIYAYYSRRLPGEAPSMRDMVLPMDKYGINAIYAIPAPADKVRVFLGLQTSVYWFDMSYSAIYDASSINTNAILDGSFSITNGGAMDGSGSNLWIVEGTSILTIRDLLSSPYVDDYAQHFAPPFGSAFYTSIYALNSNVVIVGGTGIISYTKNAGVSWTDILLEYSINSVCAVDSLNAVAVCNNGIILYTKDGYNTWNLVPQSMLNGSGNANTLTDPSYNLTNIRLVDINNFYITKTLRKYSLSTNTTGMTSVFHVYLPELFNNVNNFVFDISGSARFSGDMNINDGGKLSTNNPTFSLLNENASTILFGRNASLVSVGDSNPNSVVVLNRDLRVTNDSTFIGNVLFNSQVNVQYNMSVAGDVRFLGDLSIDKNVNVRSNLNVNDSATISSNLNVLQNAAIDGTMAVVGNTTMSHTFMNGTLNVVGPATMRNTVITGTLNVAGNTTLAANLNVLQNVNFSKKLLVGDSLQVVGNAAMNNMYAFNANINTLCVSGLSIFGTGLSTFGSDFNALQNGTIQNNLYVYGNTDLSQNATVGGGFTTSGNITALKTIRSAVFDGTGISNAGTLNVDFAMGLPVQGAPTRNIKIGNFTGSGTINNINIGGNNDAISLGGSITTFSNVQIGPVLYLNKPSFNNSILVGNNSSVGSGILISERGNTNAGFILVPSDKSGFLFRPTNPTTTNVLKFDVERSVLPAALASGLMTLTRSTAGSDSTYTMAAGAVDPSNILLGNKYLATIPSPQVIDTGFSVVGHMSVGGYPTQTQAQCSLEIYGNVLNTNGYIWQF